VAAPETANNAYANAAMIPLLTLGIPSSPTIAVLMGAFIINGLTPGPFLFKERPDLVWAVIASFMIGNIMLLILNLPFVGLWARLLRLPYQYVCVGTLLFCVIGAYSLQQSIFDVGVMIVCGVIGYGLRKIDIPIAPFVLGLILGPFIEKSLRTSLEMSGGDFSTFYTRPLCLALLLVAGAVLVGSVLQLAPREVRQSSS
jgi:putative tricarboxylic transport membrane protein